MNYRNFSIKYHRNQYKPLLLNHNANISPISNLLKTSNSNFNYINSKSDCKQW